MGRFFISTVQLHPLFYLISNTGRGTPPTPLRGDALICVTSQVAAKKCRDGALFLPYLRHKVLYLCFSSEQAAEAHLTCAAQDASKEKSAETVLYDAKKEGPQLAVPSFRYYAILDRLCAVSRRFPSHS